LKTVNIYSTNKIKASQAKVKLCNTKVQDGNMNMFSKPTEIKCDDLSTLIWAHLTSLEEKVNHYFWELSIHSYKSF